MDEKELMLDGNALGGLLAMVFGEDVTNSAVRCAGCGRIDRIGAQHLYRYPLAPGAVLRCAACEGVLLVLVERAGDYHLALTGMSWIELPAA